jgi:rhomboid protease GluP
MKENFPEILKNKTDKELELISKDHVFYTPEERLLAFNELESRNKLNNELAVSQIELIESLKVDEEELIPSHKISFKDLIPHKNYLFTPTLIYINVFIFLLMTLTGVSFFEPRVDSLIAWGGNVRFLTLNGQYWRLLTSFFLHAGIFHLVFNMYALLYVGAILESAVGKFKYVFAYVLAGLVASISSLIINENIVSVGASGAIFGLFGTLIVLLLFKKIKISNVSNKSLLLSVGLFVFYNIFYGFSNEGIDNAAHVGGFICGLLIGFSYYLIFKGKIKNRPKT